MRIFGFALFVAVVVFPASLFAQGVTGSGISSSSTGDVTNLSEAGGFIGGGRPDAFVGTTEIYNTSSTRSTSSATRATNSRVTTTQRRTATSTAAMQRRTGTMGGFSSLGSSSQTIRSHTSLDSDLAVDPMQRPQPNTDTHLARLSGVQDSRVSLTPSPRGTTAVLRGTVASERERRVAQQLLLLEPGIDRVENLLEIR